MSNQAVAFASTRTSDSNVPTLAASDAQQADVSCLNDAAFAVHPDCKSGSGMVFTLGEESISSVSAKKKINARSSTEAELVRVDDCIASVLWHALFVTGKVFGLNRHCTCNNASCLKLEVNGKAPSGKRTRHFNIKCFCITGDLIKTDLVQAVCCPAKPMMADHTSKPLTCTSFKFVRAWILNLPKCQICEKVVISQQEKKVKTKLFDGQCRSVLTDETNEKK